jgi:hypothetical protein
VYWQHSQLLCWLQPTAARVCLSDLLLVRTSGDRRHCINAEVQNQNQKKQRFHPLVSTLPCRSALLLCLLLLSIAMPAANRTRLLHNWHLFSNTSWGHTQQQGPLAGGLEQ